MSKKQKIASLPIEQATKKEKKVETAEEREARLAAKKQNPCLCGCGEMVERFFKQGHDARVHGWLLAVQRGKRKPNELPQSVLDAIERNLLKWPEKEQKPTGRVLAS